MFQEEVADLTAEHLRTHIEALLAEIQTRHGDSVRLLLPKSIETQNLVGGVYNTTFKNMPAYAVDVIEKSFAGESADSLWLYRYDGHIAGVMGGNDEENVNKSCKRHEAAVEQFVRNHLNFHHDPELKTQINSDFDVIGFEFLGAAYSGAEEISGEVAQGEGNKLWIAGFRIDLAWVVSEQGPGNHA